MARATRTPLFNYRDLPALTEVKRPLSRAGWIFELKYDGFRVLAQKHRDEVSLASRKGTNLLPCYPEIGDCLRALPDVTLDGELVILDEQDRSQFERLRRRLALKRRVTIEHTAKTEPAVIFAFDLLWLKGRDLRKKLLLSRKELLRRKASASTKWPNS